MSKDQLCLTGLRLLLCSLGSLAIGYAIYGARIFDLSLVYFQFTTAGLITGVFVSLAHGARLRWTVLAGVVQFLLLTLLAQAGTWELLLRNGVWVCVMIAAIRAAVFADRQLSHRVFGRVVAWAATFAAARLVAVSIMAELLDVTPNPEMVTAITAIGALIGIGVGLGNQAAEFVAARVGARAEAPA